MDQRRLVERARGGDHDAFSELARAAVVVVRALILLRELLTARVEERELDPLSAVRQILEEVFDVRADDR